MNARTGTFRVDGERLRSDLPARRAFTLLEVLIVVAVLSVVSLGVVISVSGVDAGTRVQRAAEDLSVLFEATAEQASLTYQPRVIELQPGSGTVRIAAVTGGEEAESMRHRLPQAVLIDAVRISADEETARPVQLLVQPSGYIQPVEVMLAYESLRLPATWNPQRRIFELHD